MNIKDLTLKNVGPFKEMHLDFPFTPNASGKLPVTLITGENGTGKSIIIDYLLMLFKGVWGIDRNIIADQHDFRMAMTLSVDEQDKTIEATNALKNESLYVGFNGNKFIAPQSDINKEMVDEIAFKADIRIHAIIPMFPTEEQFDEIVEFLKQNENE